MNRRSSRSTNGLLTCSVICLSLLWSASAAAGASFYEMLVSPTAEAPAMTEVGQGFGPLPGGLQGDGTGRIIDTPALVGNNGFYRGGLSATFTIDMKVKSNIAAVQGTGARRSMGIHDGSFGRGIRIETAGLRLVDGSGGTIGTAAAVDLTNFRRVRIVVAGGAAYIYDLDSDLDADPSTYNFALLAGPVGLGDSGCGAEITGLGGAVHLNTLSGGGTSNSDFTLDYFRIDAGVDRGATGAPIVPPVSSFVTPETVQSSGAFYNAPPTPGSFVYTFLNASDGALAYAVSEVNDLGAATDYSWVSVDPVSGNIPLGQEALITATLNSTGLVPGTHRALLKFDDGAAAPASFVTEDFTYADGALVGNDSWTGNAAAAQIGVVGSQIRLAAGAGAADVNAYHPGGAPDNEGIISVKIQAKKGLGGSVIGNLFVGSTTGQTLGRLRLKGEYIRIAPFDDSSFTDYPLSDGYTDWEMRINTMANTTEYWHGTTLLGTYSFGSAPASAIGNVRFMADKRTDVPNEYIMLDNLEVKVLQQFKVRAIDLTVTGCSITALNPLNRTVGGCGGTAVTTETFTIQNNGAYDWTGFAASQYGDEDDWLALEYISGPVPRGGTATITARIDWSLVPSSFPGDDQVSTIRFSATCDNGANWVHETVANALTVVSGLPQVINYKGDVLPNTPDSGGPGISFVNYEGIEQGTIVVDPDAIDGLAYRIQDSGSAKTKWRSTPLATITPASGATVVARVKTISATGSLGQNLMIHDAVLTSALHWGGPNSVLRETERSVQPTIVGDAAYHFIRLTLQDEGGSRGVVLKVYLDEDLPDHSTPVLELTNTSALGSATELLDSFGFGTGSTGGTQDIYIDCFNATNAGAFAPGEESSCLGGSLRCTRDCNVPRVDVHPAPAGDGDVDMDDFAELQRCLTLVGPLPEVLTPSCRCMDRLSDGVVDPNDVAAFVRCSSGPGVEWISSPNCPN